MFIIMEFQLWFMLKSIIWRRLFLLLPQWSLLSHPTNGKWIAEFFLCDWETNIRYYVGNRDRSEGLLDGLHSGSWIKIFPIMPWLPEMSYSAAVHLLRVGHVLVLPVVVIGKCQPSAMAQWHCFLSKPQLSETFAWFSVCPFTSNSVRKNLGIICSITYS